MGRHCPVVDWRCAEAYAPLHRLGRHGFAWEWLRRLPAYRAAGMRTDRALAQDGSAETFGLHRFEPVESSALAARPIWRAEADPYVLIARASPASGDDNDLFDLRHFGKLAVCHAEAGREHWLFSDGWRHIRLDVVEGTLRAGPKLLEYRLSGLTRAVPRIITLRRLITLVRTGRLAPTLFPPERRAHRWILVLRTHDALAAGASQRDIAVHLFELGDPPRWRVTAPFHRRRVQRLVEAARRAAHTDPLLWLNNRFP